MLVRAGGLPLGRVRKAGWCDTTRYADDLLGQQLPHEPPPAAFSGSEELERRIDGSRRMPPPF
jgi:hypothetical protein